ncbi:uncharacterized protein LOC132041453 [Lycium ferocissimum]|uniref:uncharacterized protein LOC132041453 n=1 Tax=Lycium ferocissimum TaxID=112874 RepID=UPI0028163615|nr:uncharacterized protein LOC132041453 [Lycium ferocissimum]
MWNVIQLLTRLVAAQARHQGVVVDQANRAISVRVQDFLGLDPPEFSGLRQNMDPQDFVDGMERTLRVMHANEIESVELAYYRLRDIVRTELECDRGHGKRDRSLDIASELKGGQRQQYSRYPSHSAVSAPSRFLGQRFDRPSYFEVSQSYRSLGAPYRQESGQMRPPFPRCAQCGRLHAGQCRLGSGACYACGQAGHVIRECPSRGGVGIVQPIGFIASSSSSVRPSGQGSQTLAGRGRGRGGASSSSDPQKCIYALASR